MTKGEKFRVCGQVFSDSDQAMERGLVESEMNPGSDVVVESWVDGGWREWCRMRWNFATLAPVSHCLN